MLTVVISELQSHPYFYFFHLCVFSNVQIKHVLILYLEKYRCYLRRKKTFVKCFESIRVYFPHNVTMFPGSSSTTRKSNLQTFLQPLCLCLLNSGIYIYEGNGNPLQYSCLENPMDRGAWQAAIHGVMKSRTRLSNFPFTFHFHALMATHSSVLAWRIPGTAGHGGLLSMGSHRVGHY